MVSPTAEQLTKTCHQLSRATFRLATLAGMIAATDDDVNFDLRIVQVCMETQSALREMLDIVAERNDIGLGD